MKNAKLISGMLSFLGIVMISMAFTIEDSQSSLTLKSDTSSQSTEVDIKNMAASSNIIVKKLSDDKEDSASVVSGLSEVNMEAAPASIVIPPRVEVYDGLTIDELAEKLNRNLGNGYIAGKGYLIANHCIELGVDPYVAVSIMLHETGCRYNCSALVRTCNNVGGQKGAPGCNGGSYKAYSTLDEGIIGFIDNLYRNYYSKGLTTIDTIATKYAQSTAWPGKIKSYVEQIRAN